MALNRLLVLLALSPGMAHATTYVGSDLNGGDLVLADGDTVEGVFTNVREFTIPFGATVTVPAGETLELTAERIVLSLIHI